VEVRPLLGMVPRVYVVVRLELVEVGILTGIKLFLLGLGPPAMRRAIVHPNTVHGVTGVLVFLAARLRCA